MQAQLGGRIGVAAIDTRGRARLAYRGGLPRSWTAGSLIAVD